MLLIRSFGQILGIERNNGLAPTKHACRRMGSSHQFVRGVSTTIILGWLEIAGSFTTICFLFPRKTKENAIRIVGCLQASFQKDIYAVRCFSWLATFCRLAIFKVGRKLANNIAHHKTRLFQRRNMTGNNPYEECNVFAVVP